MADWTSLILDKVDIISLIDVSITCPGLIIVPAKTKMVKSRYETKEGSEPRFYTKK